MPRSNRYIVPGHIYHVTHRCHNRSFLLKFGRDRTDYLDLLRQQLRQLKLPLLNYDITSNHVHLLIRPEDPESLSLLMQMVAGDMAQAYNLRKKRSGAYGYKCRVKDL